MCDTAIHILLSFSSPVDVRLTNDCKVIALHTGSKISLDIPFLVLLLCDFACAIHLGSDPP